MNQTTALTSGATPSNAAGLPGATSPIDFSAIALRDVHKHFGSVHAVDGIDLTVEPGEIVAFLGPNGAGKTTTIDMLLGLSRPTRGAVEVYGMEPHQAIARGLVAAVMQTGGLLKDLHGRRDGAADRDPVRADPAGRRRSCNGPGSATSPTGWSASARAASSSGSGSPWRCCPTPSCSILDEPTTGMDVEGRRDFWSAIRQDAGRGRTVLFATHYLEEADAVRRPDRPRPPRPDRRRRHGVEIKAMASGRTVRATWPDADQLALLRDPGGRRVEVRGDTVLVHAATPTPWRGTC